MQPRNRKICLLAIVGTLLLVSHCKSHQMNISNTWTLPQDGFTVFYRFFRDKISWYEADAVCQFHHANLVTVDNGVKYDASRAYLSDLNVTENVWIGLMRSQNSDRFMWSNSKILDREFGYWAEQIPAIESPLCAVVDPMRDYRWHSLRCGGPDVASFLCEMEAPEWATECLIRALPSLTIQYIADSATIELSRDCGVEGIKRLTCNGKQDQDLIQRELMCLSERESITSDNEMKSAIDELPSDVGADEALQSDNAENNSIDKVANQIEASVADKIGYKLHLDDVMMGDTPIASQEATDIKPVKTMKKIASEKPLKNQPKQMRKRKNENKEDVMMGDEPIEEILPHVKKVINENVEKSQAIPTTPKSVPEIQQTTVEVRNRRETEDPIKTNISATTTESNIKRESEQAHVKNFGHKEASRDHFIPPMLLVQHQNSSVSQPPLTVNETDKSTPDVESSTNEPIQNQTFPTQQTQVPTITTTTTTTTSPNDLNTIDSSVEASSTVLTTVAPISSTTFESITLSSTVNAQLPQEHHMMRPHAPKFGGEISYHAPNQPAATKGTADSTQVNESISVMETANATDSSNFAENATNSIDIGTGSTTIKSTAAIIEETTQSQTINEPVTEFPHFEVAKRSNADKHQHKQEHKQDLHHNQSIDMNTKHADFTNSNLDYKNYKPNRKRILTKAETHTFIQKVFG